MHRAAPLLLTFALAGCASTSTGAKPAQTQYRVGDTITYRYAGAALEAPVELHERIDAVDGLTLRIHVTARRGAQTREWIQVVTDTPENKQKNAVDALYEVEDGREVKLANDGNRDLYRLYGWIVPPSPGKTERLEPVKMKVDLPGGAVDAECGRFRQLMRGRWHTMTACDSAHFVWTHASVEIIDDETGAVFYEMKVTAVNRL